MFTRLRPIFDKGEPMIMRLTGRLNANSTENYQFTPIYSKNCLQNSEETVKSSVQTAVSFYLHFKNFVQMYNRIVSEARVLQLAIFGILMEEYMML